MEAKSGVDRYRSAVSGIIARTVDPSGAFLQTSNAVHTVAPPDVPQKMPSSLAKS